MGATRYLIPALLIGSGLLTGCAAEEAQKGAASESDDWGDAQLYPEAGGKYAQELTALNGTCAWNSTTGLMTITTGAVDQTVIIGSRSDASITVNGALCAGTSGAVITSTTITRTTLKNIVVTGGTTADVVILDFLNGAFAPGVAAGAGIKVALSTGTGDAVRIRGTSLADTITFGTPVVTATVVAGTVGIGTGTDAYRDIEVTGADSFSASLGMGNDVLSSLGGTAVGTSSTVLIVPISVNGGADDDTITGGTGSDTLDGAAGNDSITGGLAADTLTGGTGDDVINQGTVTDGGDTIVCTAGSTTDTVSYALRTIAVSVIVGTTGAVTGAAASGEGGATEGDTIDTTCDIIIGGSGNDTLAGDASANVLTGGAGNDTLTGYTGADTINGGTGDDTIVASLVTTDGDDQYNGDAGTDTVDYSIRTVVGSAMTFTMGAVGADGLSGETDDITSTVENLISGSGADTITGSDGDNVITGGLGADSISGGIGNDTFLMGTVTDGADTINGDADTDTVSYAARTISVVVTIDGTANDGQASEVDNVATTVENVTGSSTIGSNLTLNATQGGELTGGAGVDTLTGGAGNDVIDGGSGGADVVDCGAGDLDLGYGGSSATFTNCE